MTIHVCLVSSMLVSPGQDVTTAPHDTCAHHLVCLSLFFRFNFFTSEEELGVKI